MERNSLLPSMPARGHGLILLIFWILVFISENMAFITIKKDDWSIKLNKSVNNYFDYKFLFNYIHIIIFIFSLHGQIEFGFFVGNYILSFLLLILGVKAPGIMTARDYFSLHNSTDLFLDVSF